MLWGEEKKLCLLYALTPVHAGAGQALRAVDLPIQRERHTGWPTVQASGIKGAMRDWCEKAWSRAGKSASLVDDVFGKAGEAGSSWAGAVTVTDARILLFPVRSGISPFVHVTAPSVLKRLKDDLAILNVQTPEEVPTVEQDEFIPLAGEFSSSGSVILEGLVVKASNESDKGWRKWFNTNLGEAENVMLVSDDIFGYLVRTATEVQAHIAIDDTTGTTKDGSLRYQEYLPADSVLYFLAFFSGVRKDGGEKASDVARLVSEEGVTTHLQIGGDFTLGKGICKVRWVQGSVNKD
ncbi:type III-B CRISPR module RAMP protein Cmr4 [Thermodesulforhabdus norvegica]|uniref:CRISPR-associated protein Cmr4 n=1 Tax=Thermodesulforhabdus norvegica TaxID=39841 RepID=A0A1I4TAY4_9BACT|nr:type III-B CRISPR module RAMP protein Cmr4 [Thermodesulforhabdus norvegica]SFM73727.1 CRISPR-associated protein Cmr4 [Thermodesulforhabdus norvegica]